MLTAHISRQQAEMLTVENTKDFKCVVSITDPGSLMPVLWAEHCCYLQFHDIDHDVENYNGMGKNLKCCTIEDAKKIVQFCDEHKNENIIVHCEAGISRSAAVALYIKDTYGHKLFGNPMGYNKHVHSMLRKAYYKLFILKEG